MKTDAEQAYSVFRKRAGGLSWEELPEADKSDWEAVARSLKPDTDAVDEKLVAIPADIFTHKMAWLTALVIARDHALVSPPDIDDKSYWEHEIHVFQAAYAELENL